MGASTIQKVQSTIVIAKAIGILILVIGVILLFYFAWDYILKIFNFTKDLGKGVVSTGKKAVEGTKKISKKTAKETKKAGEKVGKLTKECCKKIGEGAKKGGKKIGGAFKKKKKKKKNKKEGYFGMYDDDDMSYWNKLYGDPTIPASNDILMNQSCLCNKGFCTCTYGSTTDYVNKYVFSDVPWVFYPSRNIYQYGNYI
jgi:hypothetical protein